MEEIKGMKENELEFELGKMKKELFELRFKARTAGTSSPAKIRTLRRSIARVNTVMNERTRAAKAKV